MNFPVRTLTFVVLLAGCQGGETASNSIPARPAEETSFQQQLAEVQHGSADAIVIKSSHVTVEQIEQLNSAGGLKQLRLDRTAVSDKAATVIAGISSLEIVNLPSSQLSDEGLIEIAQLPNLELLRIGSPHVSDRSIEAISKSKSIRYLHLIDTPISDAAVNLIAQMEQLESFYADGTPLSDQAISQLVKQKPDLHVHINDLHPAGHDPGHSHADHSHPHEH